jgi:diguanylate cyclase (GGDEF)-like protein
MRLSRSSTRDDEAGVVAPSGLTAAALIGAVVLIAVVMVLLSGLLGAAVTAALAVVAGAAAGWSAVKLSERLNEVSGHDVEAFDSQMQRQVKSIKRLAIYDPTTALYHRWYFELRLAEELHRCQRYGLSMAVLYLRLGKSPTDPTFALEPGSEIRGLAQITSHVVRSVDLLAHLGENEYAVCLPHSDAEGAEAAVARIAKELKEYEAEIGYAVYPEDAADADSLIVAARDRAISAFDQVA